MNLIENILWEYRLDEGGPPGVWRDNLLDIIQEHDWTWSSCTAWPASWRVHGPFSADGVPAPGGAPRIPGNLPVSEMRAGPDGNLDFLRFFEGTEGGNAVWIEAELELEHSGILCIHASADWWMEWWVDGNGAGHTYPGGNHYRPGAVAHAYPLRLEAGRHRMAAKIIAGSQGWSLKCEATLRRNHPMPPGLALHARLRFPVEDPALYASLTLRGAGETPPRLNGRLLPPELEGMHYEDWAGLPASSLNPGLNTLEKSWTDPAAVEQILQCAALRHFQRNHGAPEPAFPRVFEALGPADIQLRSGPVLGWTGERRLGIRCGTNGRTALALEIGSELWTSPEGTLHAFDVEGLPAGEAVAYRLRTPDGRILLQSSFRIPDPAKGFTVGVVGDPSPNPERFEAVMSALAGQRPDALLLLGDLTSQGKRDAGWDSECFSRCGQLLATCPVLAIRGNHEEASPLFDFMFATPGDSPNWVLSAGPVTFIGMDGALAPDRNGRNADWLRETLDAVRTPFVFLANHYPAFSSAAHGAPAVDGLPVEPPMRATREGVLPLAARHGVSAMFHGHEHGYERSVLPGGVSAIICAGGGGRLYSPRLESGQNPHAVVNRPEFHFGLLRVEAGSCHWRAVALSGEVLDETAFPSFGRLSSDSAPVERPGRFPNEFLIDKAANDNVNILRLPPSDWRCK